MFTWLRRDSIRQKELSTKPQRHHRIVFSVRNLIFRTRRPSSREMFALAQSGQPWELNCIPEIIVG